MIRPSRRLAPLALGGAMLVLSACGGDADGPTSGGTTAVLRVVNTTSRPVTDVRFSACTDAQWGPDRLGGATIAPGQAFTFGELPPGCYDLRAALDDSRTAEQFEVPLRAGQRYDWGPPGSSFVVRRAVPAAPGVTTLRPAARGRAGAD